MNSNVNDYSTDRFPFGRTIDQRIKDGLLDSGFTQVLSNIKTD